MNEEEIAKVIICGAGGHARSVLDIALKIKEIDVIGCIDTLFPKVVQVPLMSDIPVIGTDEDLPNFYEQGIRHIFFAIGDNGLRKKLYTRAIEIGFEPVNIISQFAIISPRAKLGKGICIMPGAIINVNTVIGDNCIINTRCSIDHDCNVGANCHIAPGVAISGYVTIGEGAHIGTGSSVIDKINIGSWSYIGGGSAVVKDINNNMLAYGVPAREIKPIKEY